jgi:hypothetical protein
MNVRPIAVAAVGLALLVAPGCGGDDEDSAPTTSQAGAAAAETQSLASFQAEAAPLCESLQAKMSEVTPPSSFPADLAEYGPGADAMLAAIREDSTALAALTPPDEHAEEHAVFAQAMTASVEAAEELQRLVTEENDDTDALALAKTNVVTFQGNAMDVADTLGLPACTELTFKDSGGH